MSDKKTKGDADTSKTGKAAEVTPPTIEEDQATESAHDDQNKKQPDLTENEAEDTDAGAETEAPPLEDAVDVTEASFAPDEELPNQTVEEPGPVVPPASPPEPRRRGRAIGIAVAGILAAIAGFFAARADLIDPLLPPPLRSPATAADIAPQIEGLQSEIAALRDEFSSIEIPEPAAAPPDFTDAIADLSASVADLTDRIAALESRPAGGQSTVDPAALQDLRAAVKDQQAEIERLANAAAEAEAVANASAQATLARAAMTRVLAAIDSGTPYANALSDLQEASGADVPPELSGPASSGVASMKALEKDFPDISRAALVAAREDDTGETGVTAFLQRQLAIRSVTPREGDGPDAILSRMEAAVAAGRLTDALAEAETLPEPAQSAMSGWLERARERQTVSAAADALMQRLSTN